MTNKATCKLFIGVKTTVLVLAMLACFYVCMYVTAYYTKRATVTKVTDNIVTVIDKHGNFWEFEGEGFKLNDKVELKMYTAHTDSNIFDDEIVSVKLINKERE